MSTLADCCTPCSTVTTTNIPGTSGATGDNGVNAFTTLTQNLTLPIVGQNVTANVADSEWMVIGQVIFIGESSGDRGHFRVVSKPSTTAAIITFLGFAGDSAVGVGISSGSGVSPSGVGINSFTVTTNDFVIPNKGSAVDVSVVDTSWMAVGMTVYSSSNWFVVTTINSATSVELTYGYFEGNSNAGNTITTGAVVVGDGGNGNNAYTTTTINFVIPAINSTVTATVLNSLWCAVGQKVFASDGTDFGTYEVTAVPTGQTVTLKFLGYVGDTTVGTINSGAIISPAGVQAAGSYTNQSVYGAGTAYTLTATPALVNFGTTPLSLTLNATGNFLLFSRVRLDYNAKTFAAVQTVTLKLRRSNNTPSDLSNGSASYKTAIVTTITYTADIVELPPILYAGTSGDVIQVWASITDATGAGTFDAVQGEIVSLRLS